jgi:metal-responsive CopG/Arc/MetJ family transcriptional regulator
LDRKIQAMLPSSIMERLDEQAEEQSISRSALVRQIIVRALSGRPQIVSPTVSGGSV